MVLQEFVKLLGFQFSGYSRNLVGQFGEKIEPPAIKQDANAVVLELPEAPSGRLVRLDPAVEPLSCGVANAVVEVVQKPLQVPLQHHRYLLDRIQATANCPCVPAVEVAATPSSAPVVPKVAEVLINRPDTTRL